MEAYITAVAAAAVMAAFADNLVPPKWQRYISLLTGAILLLTLISPLLKLRKIELPTLTPQSDTAIEYDLSGEVERELSKRVEADIRQRLLDEFNINTSARVNLSISDGKIAGVNEIILDCPENSAVDARLREVYGCENILRREK